MTLKTRTLTYVAAGLIGFFLAFYFKGCQPKPHDRIKTVVMVDTADKRKVAELEQIVKRQDDLISKSSNTVNATGKMVIRYVEIYHNQHDTLTVPQVDTLVTDCDSLAIQSERNDSLHLIQESTLKNVIAVQQSEIDTVSTNYDSEVARNAKLERKVRRNRRIAVASTGIALVEAGLIYLLAK